MKTSNKTDELKKIKKGGGSTDRVPMDQTKLRSIDIEDNVTIPMLSVDRGRT